MTFAECLAEAYRLLPGDAVAVEVQGWHHKDGRESLNWSIWSAKRQEHFRGDTPELALAVLRRFLDEPETRAKKRIAEVAI